MFENFSTWLRHRREDKRFRGGALRAVSARRSTLHGFQKYPCPCCGLPTIDEPGIYDICAICWWEDDGHDGDSQFSRNRITITEARANFYSHLSMFPLGMEPEGIADTEEQRELKRELVTLFEQLRSDTDSGSQEWIRARITRSIREFQQLR